jgi:hypothetical protein
MPKRNKVTLANMRAHGVRSLLVYCANSPRCWHSGTIAADRWSDDRAISELEPLFVCTRCGAVGAELRPNWAEVAAPVSYAYGRH